MYPTNSRVHELLSYDPLTGKLFWKVRVASHVPAGSEAGYINSDGYVYVGIDQRMYPAQCIIWLMVYGYYPTEQIDHADHNRSNNILSNLTEAGFIKNQKNKKKFKNNTSGVSGVYLQKSGRYLARVYVKTNGIRESIGLGLHDTIEEAAQARDRYLKANGYHPNHGK